MVPVAVTCSAKVRRATVPVGTPPAAGSAAASPPGPPSTRTSTAAATNAAASAASRTRFTSASDVDAVEFEGLAFAGFAGRFEGGRGGGGAVEEHFAVALEGRVGHVDAVFAHALGEGQPAFLEFFVFARREFLAGGAELALAGGERLLRRRIFG